MNSISTEPLNVHNGEMKWILALMWRLIRHFHMRSHGSDSHLEQFILAWVQAQIPDQNIKNFTKDWNDGVALCALVEHIEPGACPDYPTLDREKKCENCSHGIELADKKLGIAKIIEPEDLSDSDVDPESIMTYISLFFKPANERLLKWVKDKMPELDREGKVTNLDTDWKNGVNLACLLDALQPGCFPNWRGLNPANASENFALAMKCGEERFGLKPVQNSDGSVDELSLATYLTHLQRSSAVDVVCEGPGLSKAFMGRSAAFEIDVTHVQRETGDSEPSITITDSKNTAIEPQIKSNGKGKFRVEYKPWSTGKLKVDIKWKGNPIPGSPFSIDVMDMATLSFSPKQKCIKIGDPIIFEVKGTSAYGDDDLDILLQDASEATDLDAKVDSIVLKSEGIVECSLKEAKPGKYKVATKVAGVNVQGSPFQIEIADPQQYEIQLSEIIKDGRLTLNKSAIFTVIGRDATSSCLVAKLQSPGASEPKEISLSQHKGSVSGKFTPTEGGIYKIHVTCAEENIPGSPIQLTATDPHRCFFDSNLPQFVQVGAPCKVNLCTKGAGPGEVTVNSSQMETLAVNGEQRNDHFTIEFIPKKVGESTIDVKFDGVSLPPTPHILSVCDASKCTASGEVFETGRAKCNEQFAIIVETKGAGKGELTAKLMHGSKTTCARTPKCDSDGTCNFPLMSYEAGAHLLNILWGGVHIPNSPFTVKVSCDATQFIAQGEGLKEATAHRPAKFELKGPQSGLLEEDMLQVKIREARYESKMVSKGEFNPTSEEALVCMTETKKGVYLVQYSVPAHGNFTIYVTIDDKSVPGSPFNVKVHPDPSNCKVFGDALEHPHSLVLGKSIKLKVDTTEAGTGELTATATDPASSKTQVMLRSDWKNKVYELKIDPKVIGEHKIEVHWNNEHVPGSPFSFDICDPTKVKVLKLPSTSAEVGKPITFLVDPRKAGKGQLQCTVKVTSVNDDQLREFAIEPKLQDNGTYSLEFIPHEIGQMQLNLTYNGENILPGPWECEIANPVLKLHSSNSHEKQNQPVKFEVSGLTKKVANKLKVSISHPRHKNPKIHNDSEQHDGRSIIYHFMPSQLGKYDIHVKIDGKDIHGSPLSVQVINPEACIIEGAIPDTIFLQQRKKFMIDTSQAGPGELSWEIKNREKDGQSSMPKLDCKIKCTNPKNATVEVNGVEPGKCELFLKWGCYAIPQMPLDITVYDPSQSSCKFEEITSPGKAKTSDRVPVLIDTTKVGCCEPTVKARGPSTEYCVDLEKIGEGEYRASFIPSEEGHQNVEILVDDVMMPSCPLTFKTYSPTNKHHDNASVTFDVGVETNDTDTSQLHLETVNPKKRYRVRVKEEKPGEWKTTCTEEDKGEQELRVLRSKSELIGQPIKISVKDQKKAGGFNYRKMVVLALLMLLIAIVSVKTIDSESRPV